MTSSEKKQKRFAEETAKLLGEKLKFYLTEFGRQEDLDEIAKEINKIRQDVFVQKKEKDNLPAK